MEPVEPASAWGRVTLSEWTDEGKGNLAATLGVPVAHLSRLQISITAEPRPRPFPWPDHRASSCKLTPLTPDAGAQEEERTWQGGAGMAAPFPR